MRKFVAALVAVVLAGFVTLFGVVAPSQAISTTMIITTALSMDENATAGQNFTVKFTPTITSSSMNSSGVVEISMTNTNLFTGSNCGNDVSLNVNFVCSVTSDSTATTWRFTNVPLSNPPVEITATFPGAFGAKSSNILVDVTVSDITTSDVNDGIATIVVSNPNPSPSPSPTPSQSQQQQQQQNPPQATQVSMTYTSATHTPASDVTSLSNGDNFPGFTVSFTGVAGGTYDSVNFLIGDPQNGHFYAVPGATSNNYSTGSAAWSPSGNNCGVTNIVRGGTALTANSGVTCMKMTTVSNGQTQYWVRFELGSASAADITFTVAAGTFVVDNESSTDQFATFLLRNDNSTSTNYSARAFQLLNASTSGGVGSSGAAGTTIALPTGIGQPVAGQTVGISATNLALNTNYSVVLRSTPQILEQGTTTATFMNTTVTIPAGLEPGWHSITFSAVRSDGVATEQVAYFKISASGMLLQTSNEVPTELALTAAPKGDQWSLGVLLSMLGIGLIAAVYTYRRRVFEMVYVLTGTGNNLDIELVEQPKQARYLPMRTLKK